MPQIQIMGEETLLGILLNNGEHELYFGIGPGKNPLETLRKHQLTLLGLPCTWVDLWP